MAKSKIQEYSRLEQHIADMQARLGNLQDDPKLQSELDFKRELEELMEKYQQTASDVVGILNPEESANDSDKGQPKRKKRKLKVYEHPDTGEVIQTRGGNHKQLREWKNEHGDEMVNSWLIRTED